MNIIVGIILSVTGIYINNTVQKQINEKKLMEQNNIIQLILGEAKINENEE